MGNQFVEGAKRAIERLVADFQANPERWWNERDLHWGLFYYLKLERMVPETYVTQLIRAEFPTLKKFDGERGHYDLVILDPESYNSPAVQSMKARASWDELLERVSVMVAVEVKLWLARLPHERADWDIQKLTDRPNKLLNAFFLNFVQLDFSRRHARDYYEELREYLISQLKKWPHLRILCVPSKSQVQLPSENWLSLS
jgi:hypothetical protein